MYVQIKRSHSIHMLSIDTRNPKLGVRHQFNNIKLSFFVSHYICLIDAVRLLDTIA